ncbi:MAG: hypothetical protein OHK0023_11030 [Anaerolineae bacterium]
MQRKWLLWVILVALVVIGLPSSPVQGQPAQTLTLTDCELPLGINGSQKQMAKCGSLNVPEDYDAVDSRQIPIFVAIIPKQNPESTLAPIFHFEGGPGFGAISQYGYIWNEPYALLNAEHDIVLIDQRGTGRSNPLNCTEFSEVAFEDLTQNLPPKEAIAQAETRLKSCLERLASQADPAQYFTANLARDTDAVRAALGYEKINLYGSSYGTWLAQFYVKMFPERVNAVGLEGTVGPWNNFVLDAPKTAQDSLYRAFDLCAADNICNQIYPNLRERLDGVLAKLRENPIETVGIGSITNKTYPVLITADNFIAALGNMPSQGALIGSIPQAVSQAESGIFTIVASILVAAAEQQPAHGMYYSVICAEEVAFFGPTEKPVETIIGSINFDAFKVLCPVWRSAELSEADVAAPSSDVPLLLLAGTFDHVTPPAYARETAARFVNSTLVEFPYQGHGVLPYSRCAQNLAKSFFAEPTKPLDVSCAANDVKPIFNGAFRLELEDYADPQGRFVAKVPKGWQIENIFSNEALTVWRAPTNEQPQILAIGVYDGQDTAQARRAAEEALNGLGTLREQATVEQLGAVITQYNLVTLDDTQTAVIVSFSFNNRTRLVFYAAPTNVFTAAFTTVVTEIFGTLFR